MADIKPPRFRADGEPDGRGQAEASKAHRFSKGDGRKRPGRPKGSRDERAIVEAIRAMPVTVTKPNGKRTRVNTLEGILLQQRKRALQGDLKAAEFIMKHIERYYVPPPEPDKTRVLLEDDALILAMAQRRGIVGDSDDENEL